MEPIHNRTTVGKQGGEETTSAKVRRPVERWKTLHQQQGLLGQYGHSGTALTQTSNTILMDSFRGTALMLISIFWCVDSPMSEKEGSR